MTIMYWPEIYQDTVSNRTNLLQDTLRLKSDSLITGDSYSSTPLQKAELLITDSLNLCIRNPVADVSYYFPDFVISSIKPAGVDLFPILFTGNTRQIDSDRIASLEKHLKEGENLPQKLYHDDWSIGIILAAIFLFSIVRSTAKSYLPGIARFFLFRGTKEEGSRDIMGIFQWQSTLINLSSFLIIGLFASFNIDYFKLIPVEISGVLVWLISLGTIIIAVTTRHLICIATGILSGQEEVFGDYLHTVYQFYRFSALLFFIMVIMMSYTSLLSAMSYFIMGAIFFLSLYLIRIFRLFIIFINRNISIFYLILYLCALEILPVLIVVKYFSGLT